MRDLRAREIIRTNNNPVGDLAEAVVAAHYGGERGGFVQAGWDVRLPTGERLQVKALRETGAGGRRNLSPIRDADYDAVIVVIFDEDFRVTEGLRIERATVEELFPHRERVNGVNRHGQPITSVDEWGRLAAPAGQDHWQDGRSAKELARTWIEGDGVGALRHLLDRNQRISGLEIECAIAEAQTSFDEWPGGTAQPRPPRAGSGREWSARRRARGQGRRDLRADG